MFKKIHLKPQGTKKAKKFQLLMLFIFCTLVILTGMARADFIAYYPMGVNVYDYSGKGQNCTTYGNPVYTTDSAVGNKAIKFDGSGDYARRSDSAVLQQLDGDDATYTIAFWVKTDEPATGPARYYDTLIERRQTNATGPCVFNVKINQNGGITVQMGLLMASTTYPLVGETAVNDDEWHYVAVVRDGEDLALYIDGELDDTGTHTADVYGNTFTIGCRVTNANSTTNYITAIMDELTLWDEPLTESDIKGVMAGLIGWPIYGGFELGTYGAWPTTGTAWGSGPVSSHTWAFGWEDTYFADTYAQGESATGTLRTTNFVLPAEGVRFRIAGYNHIRDQQSENHHNYVVLKRASDNAELDRVWAPQKDSFQYEVLSSPTNAGETVYIQVFDTGNGSYGWMAVDNFELCDTFDGDRKGSYFKIVDSSNGGFHYAYAPSMIYDRNTHTIHCWFGSHGTGYLDWDHVRYTYSTNGGSSWSTPVNQVVGCDYDRCACDPCVVKWTDGYWYNFYSGNVDNIRTCIFVARASSPNGTWYKYTQRGTWEVDPDDPKIMIRPKHALPHQKDGYGAGQATVVVKNNKLLMWYSDDTSEFPTTKRVNKLYFTSTTNPVSWSTGTETDIPSAIAMQPFAYACSIDVKWDPYIQSFVLYSTTDEHEKYSYLARFYSRNGINWAGPYNRNYSLPYYSNNIGVLGDKYGHMCLSGSTIIAFGCPYDLAHEDEWGRWDLYGCDFRDMIHVKGDFDGDGKLDAATVDAAEGKWYIRSSQTGGLGVSGISWGFDWTGMTKYHRIACGDYDGDGITEPAIVSKDSKWYILNKDDGAVWGWHWTGMNDNHEIVIADYDGDGKDDRTICNPYSSGGARWYCVDSSGTDPFSWGDQISAQSSAHTIVLGDFDGDGKADRAFYNPFDGSSSRWWCKGSSGSNPFWNWEWTGSGGLGFVPVVEDYCNDDVAQCALVSASGNWFIVGTSDYSWGENFTGMTAMDKPIPGDYDNDGKASAGIRSIDIDDTGSSWYVDDDSNIPWGWQCTIDY